MTTIRNPRAVLYACGSSRFTSTRRGMAGIRRRPWEVVLTRALVLAALVNVTISSVSPPLAFVPPRCGRLLRRGDALRLVRMSGAEPEPVGRRALIARTLGPLAAVVTSYTVTPLVLGPDVRKKDFYQSNFASRMEGMDDYEASGCDPCPAQFSPGRALPRHRPFYLADFGARERSSSTCAGAHNGSSSQRAVAPGCRRG